MARMVPWSSPAMRSKASRMFRVPVETQMSIIPSANPTSPTRLTMKAFFAASAAERLPYQKPISR